MKTQNELYDMRGKFEEFNNPLDLKNNALLYFDQEYNFPLISGYIWDNQKDREDWKLRYLPRKSVSDELTVRNFFEGLEKISTFRQGDLNNFKGEIYFNGIESTGLENLGECLFFTKFTNLNESYSLIIKFSKFDGLHNGTLNELAYSAYAHQYISEIQKVMGNYLGPNKK